MKICIICPDEKNYLPHINKYTEFLSKNSVAYDIVFWCHEELPASTSSSESGSESKSESENEYNFYDEANKNSDSIYKKIKSAYKYKRYVMDILEKNNYDRLIIFSTLPALLLRKYLHNNYKGRYLFDYRGYTFEGIPFYKSAIDKLIDDSDLTTISSHGFMDYLNGNKKITVNHSISKCLEIEPELAQAKTPDIKGKSVINIGFIGKIKHYDENCMLLSKLKNEFKYQLWYLGKATNEDTLDSFCETNKITNVSFVGKYVNAQKLELYKNMDIINAVYGDDTIAKRTLLPTRLYDACMLKKPIIASKDTFLAEVIERYNLGVCFDVDKDDVLAIINEYTENFNVEEFEQGCQEFLDDVQNDEDNLQSDLRQFIKQRKPKKKHQR